MFVASAVDDSEALESWSHKWDPPFEEASSKSALILVNCDVPTDNRILDQPTGGCNPPFITRSDIGCVVFSPVGPGDFKRTIMGCPAPNVRIVKQLKMLYDAEFSFMNSLWFTFFGGRMLNNETNSRSSYAKEHSTNPLWWRDKPTERTTKWPFPIYRL